MCKYRPAIGFTLMGLSIPLDIVLGRSGAIFGVTMVAMVVWSQYGPRGN